MKIQKKDLNKFIKDLKEIIKEEDAFKTPVPYIPKHQEPCPSCGYCPACGHKTQTTFMPYFTYWKNTGIGSPMVTTISISGGEYK